MKPTLVLFLSPCRMPQFIIGVCVTDLDRATLACCKNLDGYGLKLAEDIKGSLVSWASRRAIRSPTSRPAREGRRPHRRRDGVAPRRTMLCEVESPQEHFQANARRGRT